MTFDVAIVGSGAAGLAAALYARRYTLETLVIGGDFGGETTIAGAIENYPGIDSIDGYDLVRAMTQQTKKLGVVFAEGKVIMIERSGELFILATDSGETFQSKTVILAIGSKRRHLGLAKEKELTGKGVHYCVTCDGPVFSGKTVAMVGGGDSSVKGVNFLAEYATKIYFIVRDKDITAEPINLERMKKLGSKVEVMLQTQVEELMGEERLERVRLSKPHNDSSMLALDGLFVEIGYDPDTVLANQLGVALDEANYLEADNMMRTNVPGVFAAGDATNHFGKFKQDITAAALGAVAATSAYDYLKTTAS